MPKRIVGIDIGETSVKVVELESLQGRIMLMSCDVVELNPSAVDGDDRDLAIIQVLRKICEEKKLKAKNSILCVSGQSVFIRTVKLPLVGKSKLNRIVQYEAQQQVPFPIEEIAWDYQIIENAEDGGVKVRLVAIKSDLIDQIIRPAIATNLVPEVIDVGVLATFNCLDFIGQDMQACHAVFEVGAKTTSISVIFNGELWSRSVPIAGHALTREIKRAMGCTTAEAENLKLEHGYIADAAKAKEMGLEKYQKAVAMTLNRMVAEVTRSFGFFRTQISNEDITKIYLIGGGSQLKNFDKLLEERFKIDVEHLNILENMDVSPEFNQKFDTSSVGHLLGGAVGLALRKLRKNPIEINLLPPRMLKQQRMAKNMIFYFAAGAIAVFALLFMFFSVSSTGTQLRSRTCEVKSEINRVKIYLDKINKEKTAFKAIDDKFKVLKRIDAKREFWLKLVEQLHASVPENIWIESITQTKPLADDTDKTKNLVQSRRRRRVRRVEPTVQVDADSRDIYLVGSTTGIYSDITEFVDTLKKIPVFDAEETDILTAKPPVNGVREFTMKAKIKKGILSD